MRRRKAYWGGESEFRKKSTHTPHFNPADYGEKPPEPEKTQTDVSLIRDQLYTAFRTKDRVEIERLRALMKSEPDANKKRILQSYWRNEINRLKRK